MSVSIADPPGCSSLDLVECLYFFSLVGVPDWGGVLKNRTNKGLVRSCLCLLIADFEILSQEPKGFVCFFVVLSMWPLHESLPES